MLTDELHHFRIHLTGPHRGSSVRLEKDRLRVGTAADADIHFPADRVSSVGTRHARLRREEEGWHLQA